MAKVVFMGTPDFAVPVLQRLIAAHEVIGVVTQPDRPAGRGGKIQISPVKQVALDAGIPIFQPEKLRRPEAIAELRQWTPDVNIVAAFGQILPQAVLDIPPYGSINVHASILPRWRGAAPIQAAIRAGDAETGVTIMQMDAGLDTGAILTQRAIPIAPDETGQSLHDKLSVLGADLLIDSLPAILDGTIQPQPQNNDLATLAGRIDKDEGRIDWTQSAVQIERTMRAFTPWPGTFTHWDGKMLKILSGSASEGTASAGQVIERNGNIVIGTGDGIFLPNRVQLEGKKPVSIDDFVRGYPAFVGSQL